MMFTKLALLASCVAAPVLGGGILAANTPYHAPKVQLSAAAKAKNIDIKLTKNKIQSFSEITLFAWNTSSDQIGTEALLINTDDYAPSLAEFVKAYPTVTLKIDGISPYGGFMSYDGITGEAFAGPSWNDGSGIYTVTLNTADLWQLNQSVKKQINSYSYTDSYTVTLSNSYVLTHVDQPLIGGGTFLKMSSGAYVWGRSGPLSNYISAFAETYIDNIIFNHA